MGRSVDCKNCEGKTPWLGGKIGFIGLGCGDREGKWGILEWECES